MAAVELLPAAAPVPVAVVSIPFDVAELEVSVLTVVELNVEPCVSTVPFDAPPMTVNPAVLPWLVATDRAVVKGLIVVDKLDTLVDTDSAVLATEFMDVDKEATAGLPPPDPVEDSDATVLFVVLRPVDKVPIS